MNGKLQEGIFNWFTKQADQGWGRFSAKAWAVVDLRLADWEIGDTADWDVGGTASGTLDSIN